MHRWSSFCRINGALQDLCMYVCMYYVVCSTIGYLSNSWASWLNCIVSYAVEGVNNMTATDVLRAIQNNSNSNNNNNNNNNNDNITTSSTVEGTTSLTEPGNHLSRLLLEATSGGDTDKLMMMSDPISDWLNQLTNSDGQTSSASSFLSSSILSLFIQQVTVTYCQ